MLGIDYTSTNADGQWNSNSFSPQFESPEKPIYFFSNEYHGRQFLTEEAKKAGYSAGNVKPNVDFFTQGAASLVTQDLVRMRLDAEDVLLRTLIRCDSSRSILKNMMEARYAVGSDVEIDWSCSEKEWLFNRLVLEAQFMPSNFSCLSELRLRMSSASDCPPGAFSSNAEDVGAHDISKNRFIQDNQNRPDMLPAMHSKDEGYQSAPKRLKSIEVPSTASTVLLSGKIDSQSHPRPDYGTLDHLFDENVDVEDIDEYSPLGDTTGVLSELRMQYLYNSLLWTSTANKAENLRKELERIATSDLVQNRQPVEWLGRSTQQQDKSVNSLDSQVGNELGTLKSISDADELKKDAVTELASTESYRLLSDLAKTKYTLRSLSESASRIRSRVLVESCTGSVKGSIPKTVQEELALKLDEYTNSLDFENDPEEVIEQYKRTMSRINAEWGDGADDDYELSPESAEKAVSEDNIIVGGYDLMTDTRYDDDDGHRETFEEFEKRINVEYALFLSDSDNQVSASDESNGP